MDKERNEIKSPGQLTLASLTNYLSYHCSSVQTLPVKWMPDNDEASEICFFGQQPEVKH